jgi:hypothetical protein
MMGGDYLKKEKRWTRRSHFEKVRILFPPKQVTITYEPSDPVISDPTCPVTFVTMPAFALRYGPRPEHLVRKYLTLDAAVVSGQKLADKFGVALILKTHGMP